MAGKRPEHILVRYDKLRHISMQICHVQNEKIHEHGVLELGLVLDGTVILSCEDSQFPVPAGGIFLVNAYEAHGLCAEGDTPARMLTLWISPNFDREYFAGIANTVFTQQTITDFSTEENVGIRKLLMDAADSYFREDRLTCVGTVSHLLASLLRQLPYKLSTEAQKIVRKKRTGRMQRIAAYLDQHYREKITLAQLADAEGLTPAYMSRVFTELFGMSFQEYLNFLRLEQAIPLVLDPSVYLMDVCMECGFSDTRYLNAVFQKVFGCSASEYRRKGTNADTRISVSELQEIRNNFLKTR